MKYMIVKKCLPSSHEKASICIINVEDCKEIRIGSMEHDITIHFNENTEDIDCIDSDLITDRMPLPKAPKEEEQCQNT